MTLLHLWIIHPDISLDLSNFYRPHIYSLTLVNDLSAGELKNRRWTCFICASSHIIAWMRETSTFNSLKLYSFYATSEVNKSVEISILMRFRLSHQSRNPYSSIVPQTLLVGWAHIDYGWMLNASNCYHLPRWMLGTELQQGNSLRYRFLGINHQCDKFYRLGLKYFCVTHWLKSNLWNSHKGFLHKGIVLSGRWKILLTYSTNQINTPSPIQKLSVRFTYFGSW